MQRTASSAGEGMTSQGVSRAMSLGSAATTDAPSASPISSNTDSMQGVLSKTEMEAIEMRFVEVLHALAAEPQFDPFRNEYEKLHRLLVSSHEGEQRLLRQVRELRSELETHQQKITTAMQLSQEDEEAINTLRREIEAAWAKADVAHEQEKRSRELLHTLRQQIAELDATVEKTAGLSMGQEAYLRDLLAVKKEREEEVMMLQTSVARTEADHLQASARLSAAEQANHSAQHELETQRDAYQQLLASLDLEQRERAAKEASVRQYRDTTEMCMRQLDERGLDVERAQREEKKNSKEIESTAQENQCLARQLQERQERFQGEAARLAAAERENTLLTHELPQRQAALREQQDELKREERKLRSLGKSARAQQAELSALVEKRSAAAAAVQERSNAVQASLTELAMEEKERRVLEEAVAKAMQRKTHTIQSITAKSTASASVEMHRVMEVGKSRRLHQRLEALRTENEKMRKAIYYAEQNHEKNTKESQQALLNYHRTLDAIRARRSEVKAVEEGIALHQKKLKAQQELLNTLTADRLKTEKVLREAEAELQQLRTRHTSRHEELEAVKTELIQQEAELCQLHGLTRQLNKDILNTEQRLRFLREDRLHAESRVDALRNEAQQLRQVIVQFDQEAQQQRARRTVMAHERNTIAAQLLLRSEELSLISEKILLTNVARISGATKYERAMETLMTSRNSLMEKRLRCRIALVRLRYLNRLRSKEVQQEKMLSQSRSRVRALADELGTKHNVHCWRSMESNAPEVLDALAKVHLLQAKLLRKQQELHSQTGFVEKEEHAYQQLRQRLARLPGPEAAEELALCAENMQQRNLQLADMGGSLATAEEEADALQVQVTQLQEKIQDTRQLYYREKIKNNALRAEEKLIAKSLDLVGTSGASARRSREGAVALLSVSRDEVAAEDASAPPAQQLLRNAIDGSSIAAADTSHKLASQSQRSDLRAGATTLQSSTHNRSVGDDHDLPRSGPRRAPQSELMYSALTAGPPQPNFPLQKPPHQRQFVGGGFSISRR